MLSFFRRLLKSRIGIIITLAALALIAVAFGLTDITGMRSTNRGAGSDTIATVGDAKITADEVRERARFALQYVRQQNPGIDMASFIAQGGLDRVIDQVIDYTALKEFAGRHGMVASKRLVDGQIASNPVFQGVDGKFDQKKYDELLAQQHVTDAQLRDEIGTTTLGTWLNGSLSGAHQVPVQLAIPYASLQLERRIGTVAFVPTLAMDPGPKPDDKTLEAFFKSGIARYTVPPRRIVRYAIVSAEQLKARATPTEAEVAAAYKAAGARFAAAEKRTISQVVVADQTAANTLAAAVKGGKAIGDAARAAGLEASTATTVSKADFAKQSSPQIADAAFGAAKGAVVGPVRSPLGFVVLRVDAVTQVGARTLDQARPELVEELTKAKTQQLMQSIQDQISDGLNDRQTFDQLVQKAGLQAQKTPALLVNGVNPDDPTAKPDPQLAMILRSGFQAEPGDDPELVPVSQDSFALVGLDRIIPAAPRAFADIHEQVLKDYVLEQARKKAHQVAQGIIDNVNRGATLPQAMLASGARLPATKALDVTRQQVIAAREQVPPQVRMAFAMAPRKAKLVDSTDGSGYYIVYLDQVISTDASGNKPVIEAARSELGRVIGPEYAEQFLAAVRKELNVTRNAAAIGNLRASLAGGQASAD